MPVLKISHHIPQNYSQIILKKYFNAVSRCWQGPVSPRCVCWNNHTDKWKFLLFLSDPSLVIGYPCHSLTHSVTFSRLDWCDPGVWRCQLKICWGCYCCWCWCWGSCWQEIWELTLGPKAKLLFRVWAQGLVKILKLKFSQDFEAGVCSVFCFWCFVEVMKLNLGRDSETRFGQDFEF